MPPTVAVRANTTEAAAISASPIGDSRRSRASTSIGM